MLCFWIEQKFPEKVETAWVDLNEKPSLSTYRRLDVFKGGIFYLYFTREGSET